VQNSNIYNDFSYLKFVTKTTICYFVTSYLCCSWSIWVSTQTEIK